MLFTPHITYIHKHCAGLITRSSQDIFSLHLAWDKTDYLQSSLHEGSKQAVRSSMLGLLSPIKHHIGSHKPKTTPKCFKQNGPVTTPYLRENPLYSKRNSSFLVPVDCSKGRSQKWVQYSQSITTAKNKNPPFTKIDVSWRLLQTISQPAVDRLPDGSGSSWKFGPKFTSLCPSQICFSPATRSHSAQHPEPRAKFTSQRLL